MPIHKAPLIKRALKLRQDKADWFVGRTDMQSFTADGQPEHWAYGPSNICVRFLHDDPDEALRQALNFAEAMQKRPDRVDFTLLGIY